MKRAFSATMTFSSLALLALNALSQQDEMVECLFGPDSHRDFIKDKIHATHLAWCHYDRCICKSDPNYAAIATKRMKDTYNRPGDQVRLDQLLLINDLADPSADIDKESPGPVKIPDKKEAGAAEELPEIINEESVKSVDEGEAGDAEPVVEDTVVVNAEPVRSADEGVVVEDTVVNAEPRKRPVGAAEGSEVSGEDTYFDKICSHKGEPVQDALSFKILC